MPSVYNDRMSTTVPFSLGLSSGTTLHGLVDLPDEPGERPAVVVCHGFKGFMEWGFFPYLGSLLADRGFVVVRFNLSGTGMLPGEDMVSDPAAFRANTHGRELAELLAVLEATGEKIAPGRVDHSRLGLFGHSRGGGNAVLAAAREPWRERMHALVTWASLADFDRYTPEQKAAWRRDGQLPVVNARTGQRLALGLGLLEDLETQGDELDVLAAARTRRAPWLIVHGEDDESVPASEADRLASASGGGHEVLRIPGASHTFGARHPFAGPTPQLIQALNATQLWFRRHLASG
jgi:dipeptidyl aminopeptidase/acylaminoacyl peptidase